MNNGILAGNWKQFKGYILEQWGKLTNADLDIVGGRREELAGKIQDGLTKDQVELQIKAFEARHNR